MPSTSEPASAESVDAGLRLLRSAARGGVTSNKSAGNVVRLSMSANRHLRAASIPALVQLTGHAPQLALISLLNDPDASIQSDAADTVGKLKIKDAIPTLVELLEHEDDGVALRAAAALGRMGRHDGLRIVLQNLRQNQEHNRLAALAMGLIVGQRFRLNQQGIEQARRYMKQHRLHKQA